MGLAEGGFLLARIYPRSDQCERALYRTQGFSVRSRKHHHHHRQSQQQQRCRHYAKRSHRQVVRGVGGDARKSRLVLRYVQRHRRTYVDILSALPDHHSVAKG